jgi:hypothetical protein
VAGHPREGEIVPELASELVNVDGMRLRLRTALDPKDPLRRRRQPPPPPECLGRARVQGPCTRVLRLVLVEVDEPVLHAVERHVGPEERRRLFLPASFTVQEAVEHSTDERNLSAREQGSFNDPAKSFEDHLESALTESSLRRFVRYKVAWNKKEDVTKFVVGLAPAKKKAALEGLRPTLEVCLKAVGLL